MGFEVVRRADRAGEEAAAQRRVGDEADAVAAAGFQRAVGLRVARPQREFALQRRDGVHLAGAVERVAAEASDRPR